MAKALELINERTKLKKERERERGLTY
jgi:hypothetical protein